MNSGIKDYVKRYGKVAHQDSHRLLPGRKMRMFYLKGCSKCQGDLTPEKDAYGAFLKCLQCGKLTEANEAGGRRSVLHGATFNEVAIRALSEGEVRTAVAT